MAAKQSVTWQLAEVKSPHMNEPVAVVVAKDIPYKPHANRMQNLSLYLPKTPESTRLVGTEVTSLPISADDRTSSVPCWHVHVHGGAWRDPQLTSSSIEAAAAHAFAAVDTPHPIVGIASINYTLSPFPTHPTLPYDPIKDKHTDPAREATHPMHIHDVLSGFALLRSLGLADDIYILSGHSCGACLAFQSVLFSPQHWGFNDLADPPRPAALLGMNGLYDLPDLVHNLGESHANLEDVYSMLLNIAFGTDEGQWLAASPARVEPRELSSRIKNGHGPKLVVLDQSTEDQLVPVNQTERTEKQLSQVSSVRVVRNYRCTGAHAAPWEQGYMIWENIKDILGLLSQGK